MWERQPSQSYVVKGWFLSWTLLQQRLYGLGSFLGTGFHYTYTFCVKEVWVWKSPWGVALLIPSPPGHCTSLHVIRSKADNLIRLHAGRFSTQQWAISLQQFFLRDSSLPLRTCVTPTADLRGVFLYQHRKLALIERIMSFYLSEF